MWATLLKAVLEWLSGLVKSEIKQDVKASDADTPKEIIDDFRSGIRRKLRDDQGGVHKDEQ